MAQRIISIDPASPAKKAGILAGDELISIGGEPIIDFLDYQALTAEKKLKLVLKRGERKISVSVRKGEYEDLGLNFEKPMMSGMRMCCNKCLFCFVDQLPKHVRETMRVKDDDWRMSLMMGNYVTLTNISDREIERIIRRHASPLYISVHVADPELRVKMMNTPRAAKIIDQLKRLSDGGIEFHTQAVLCPNINDGEKLDETIRILKDIPGALSLALVPVGLTGHREGLYPLKTYTRAQAAEVIRLSESWHERLLRERGTRFVFPSDEFYLTAGMPIPDDDYYEDYAQIDDGVGLLRLLEREYVKAWEELEPCERCGGGALKFQIGCGVSAAPFLRELLCTHPVRGVEVEVIPIENRFFGPSVTVSGLITGGDLVNALQKKAARRTFITECMLRNEGDRFLDDMTLLEAEEKLGRKIVPVGRRGDELLDALISARDEMEVR